MEADEKLARELQAKYDKEAAQRLERRYRNPNARFGFGAFRGFKIPRSNTLPVNNHVEAQSSEAVPTSSRQRNVIPPSFETDMMFTLAQQARPLRRPQSDTAPDLADGPVRPRLDAVRPPNSRYFGLDREEPLMDASSNDATTRPADPVSRLSSAFSFMANPELVSVHSLI